MCSTRYTAVRYPPKIWLQPMSSSMAQAWHGLLISTGTQPRVDEKKRKPSHTRHHVGIERQTTSTVAAWDYWSKYNKRKHVFPSSVFLYLVLVYPPHLGPEKKSRASFFFCVSSMYNEILASATLEIRETALGTSPGVVMPIPRRVGSVFSLYGAKTNVKAKKNTGISL